jgi:hypothetical protein
MWLTNMFFYPNWYTYCDFSTVDATGGWHNTNNPSPENNTGHTEIENDQVRIEIDYEVVDLGQGNWSPLACWYEETHSGYVKSDRYIMLQTYTIRNITGETLTGLEFYQMLHSHGADDYGPVIRSVYENYLYDDPLENYTPYNPVHTMGNFRYDITQWNNPGDPLSDPHSTSHRDWIGFSTAREPDVFENGYYQGHNPIKPSRPGTHWDIEDRNLNGEESSYGEAAGALGWLLGSLAPNETTSITVAFMFGYGQGNQPNPQPWTHSLTLSKTDDVSTCVEPDDEIVYTLTAANPITNTNDPNYIGTVTDVTIVDYLPPEITYPLASQDPCYDVIHHTYTWTIGTLEPGDSAAVQLTVTVNTLADPNGHITNTAKMYSDVGWVKATEITNVCCWGDDIIHVDAYATGHQTGVDWDNAYTDLQDALARTAAGCGDEIWVARGTYSPGSNTANSFVVPANVSLYGGFAGMETARDDRNHTRYQTILTGYINETTRNNIVVTMGDDSILDGFVVEKGNYGNIKGTSTDFSVSHCTVRDNLQRGISCENGNLTIQWCNIKDNGYEGIYHAGSGKTITIGNCKISGNQYDGIKIVSSAPQIKNSFIYRNGFGEYSYHYGSNIGPPSSSPIIRNNTIVHNGLEGIKFAGSTNAPDIRNCIIWYNNGNDPNQLSGYKGTYYTCITDPSDPNGIDPNSLEPTARGNIKCNPKFTYSAPYPHNYHLKADSPCIDKGNNTGISNEKDIDNNDRIINGTVDMGADELSCEDVENVADFNSSGIVNLAEFAMFSDAWLSVDPNYSSQPDLNWNSRCNLDNDDEEFVINIADLVVLADNWLWSACWRSSSEGIWSMMMAGGGGDSSSAMTTATSSTIVEVQPQPAEMPLEERMAQLTEILNWLEDEISQDAEVYETITEEQLKAFVDDLTKMLEDLKTDYDSD